MSVSDEKNKNITLGNTSLPYYYGLENTKALTNYQP